MRLIEIINSITTIDVIGNTDLEINEFSKDTRTIKENDIYLGIKGESFDGNKFYNNAFENGAKACILDNEDIFNEAKEKEHDKCIILVKDTIKALQEYAASVRNKMNIPVIGITGSAGKTSTKDMMASVISTKYKTFKSEQNYNNEIGCPLMMTKYNGEEVAVLEMGTSGMGEIDILSKIVRPTISVITNIGTAHIGMFGSRENILKAKIEIVNGMDSKGILVINNDNDLLHKYYLENKDKLNIITYGIDNTSDVMATNIEIFEEYSTFKCDGIEIKVPISGLHFIYNTLAIISVCKILNIELEKVSLGLEDLEMSSNRMDITKKNNITIINDAYNANAEACIYALKYLANINTRRIAVLGSMKELGEYTKELHEKVAQECIDSKIDIVLSIGEEMNYLYDYLKENNFNNNFHFDDLEDLTKYLKKIKKDNDAILLKASHSVGLFKIVDEL